MIAITGTKGKSTTTELTGRILEAAGFKVTVGGNIGAPLSRAGCRIDARHAARGRGEQLSARADRRVPPVGRGDAELLAGPSRSPRYGRGVRRGEGANLREPGAGRLGGDQRRRSRRPRPRAPRARSAPPVLANTARSTRAPSSRGGGLSTGVAAAVRHAWSQRPQSIFSGRICSADVMAAATVGAMARGKPAAMTSAVESFTRSRARHGAGRRS